MVILLMKSFFALAIVIFGALQFSDFRKSNWRKEGGNIYISAAIGGISYFFDALGIGSFATSTALLRFFRQVSDRLLPGTLNVSCAIPTLLESFVFLSIIAVDYLTLVLVVIASAFGGWLGASYVTKLPEARIRVLMSFALFFTATLMILSQLHLLPVAHADAIGLTGIKLVVGTILGGFYATLLSVGIGSFAPTLATFYLLGMNAKSIFPIMMSACAVGSVFTSLKFVKAGMYNRKVTMAMTVLAIVGVLVAAYLVKSLPLKVLTWMVVIVIYYSSFSLFWAYWKSKNTPL
jgi:uncharacterized membrane protein YfcA